MNARLVTLLAVAVAFSLAPGSAHADVPTSMDADMRAYFGGEKAEGWVFMGSGAASIGGGVFALTRTTGFSRGLGWTTISLGAVEIFGVGIYALGLDSKIDELSGQLARDPAGYRRDELPRVEGVKSRFVAYRFTEIGILAVGAGLATYGFAKPSPTFQGVGIGLAGEAALLLVLDYFAERRAHTYADQIRAFTPSVSLRDGGAFVGVSSRF